EQIRTNGINSVRGAAARAIASLLFADWNRSTILVPVIERMVADPDLAIRTCVFDAILPIWNHDKAKAVDLFVSACKGADAIFGCDSFEQFMRYATPRHNSELRPILQRGLGAPDPSVVEAVARQICLAGFWDEVAERDAEAVRTGNDCMRLAAAQI